MRLIDADALIEDIKSFWDWDSIDGITATTVLKQTMTDISNAPTIDAEPVRHGRWVIDDEYIDCSVCRREKWSRALFEDLVKRFKYCPKCGAKMDEEER